MMIMRVPALLALLVPALSAAVHGAFSIVDFTRSWNGSATITDNNPVGVSSTLDIFAPGYDHILAVTVELQLAGGWNGDLYAYLVHNDTLAILLNRPGRTVLDDLGSGSTDLSVVFNDLAAGDIHLALPDTGPATGVFQPDGRFVDPLVALDTSPRTRLLSGFKAMDPNGAWTLFLADLGPGDEATLTGWSLTVTAVPEPSAAMLCIVAGTVFLRRRRG
jgi:subtilisin-like proprotein convertase family protein